MSGHYSCEVVMVVKYLQLQCGYSFEVVTVVRWEQL